MKSLKDINSVPISDMDYWQFQELKKVPLLVSLRGCNGSGKSTIPLSMMDDPGMYILTWYYNNKVRPLATVFPTYDCMVMGTYFNKTGGMDTYKNNKMIRQGLELCWLSPYNIIMEGAVASTIFSTYGNLYKEFEEKPGLREREIVFVTLTPEVEVCLQRILQRNGGVPVNEERIKSHWRSIKKNVKYWESYGYYCMELDNTEVPKDEILDWFNEEVYRRIGKKVVNI